VKIEYKIHEDDGDVIPCDSCNSEVPTHPFDWRAPFDEEHDRPKRYLCEFCASSYVGNITRYSPRDEAGYMRKEIAVLIAQAVNFLRKPGK
jgi:hypothetical protein